MKGNLLLCEDSFQVTNWLEFPKLVEILSTTIGEAREINNDVFFRSEDLLYMKVTDEMPFYELCYVDSKEDENKKREMLGITDQSFNDFINLIIELQYLPALTSNDLTGLEKKLSEQNNGLAGVTFKDTLDRRKCVREIDSWYMFHFNYYRNNPSSTYFFDNQKVHCDSIGLKFNPLFPNIHYTNQFYTGRWNLFYGKDKSEVEIEKNEKLFERDKDNFPWNLFYGAGKSDEKNEGYRNVFGTDKKGIPLFSKMATFIANRNFYWYDKTLSKYNDKNNPSKGKTTSYQIFVTGEGENRKYLSTDFTLGGFELCDFRGKHQGEYFFNGNFNENSTDTSGDHDIVFP
jgi:hypothetical protein